MSVAIVVVMLLAVPSMAAVVIVFAAINLAATAGLRHAAIDVSRRSLRVAAQADAYFLENARAARAIKLFGKELVRIRRLAQQVRRADQPRHSPTAGWPCSRRRPRS